MVEPVIPAADRVTAEAVVVEQRRDVVPATTWLVDAARTATRSGRALQVLTPEGARLTFALELLLRDALGDWVVRDDSGGHYDGFRGFPLRWNGIRFVRDPDAPPPLAAEPVPGSGDLEVRLITLRNGRTIEMKTSMGAATASATRSALCKASDLGTISPRVTST